ncbi:MAG TPA: VOC family protein [Gemmatimonadales bacterium]|nr:VOC family protein [Gemmatimonadales bacterium]
MIPRRLSVVTRITDDVPALAAFYERMGWAAAPGADEDHAILVLGGATLFLWSRRQAEPEIGAPMRAAGHAAPDTVLAINVETRDEVDAAIETARAGGATVITEPVDREWGGRSAHFCDPDGTAWEVAWVPGSRVSDDPAVAWPAPGG